MTTQDSSTYWKRGRVELRAAGFDPDRAAQTNAVVTIASAYTNAHRCNNRVRAITDLLVEILAERGGHPAAPHHDRACVRHRHLADNLADFPTLEQMPPQEIVFPVSKPIAPANTHQR